MYTDEAQSAAIFVDAGNRTQSTVPSQGRSILGTEDWWNGLVRLDFVTNQYPGLNCSFGIVFLRDAVGIGQGILEWNVTNERPKYLQELSESSKGW